MIGWTLLPHSAQRHCYKTTLFKWKLLTFVLFQADLETVCAHKVGMRVHALHFHLNFSDLLKPDPKALLVFTDYLPGFLDLRDLHVPFVLTDAEIASFRPNWGFTGLNGSLPIPKSFHTVTVFFFLGKLKPMRHHLTKPRHKVRKKSSDWHPQIGEYRGYHMPNPLQNLSFYNQKIVVATLKLPPVPATFADPLDFAVQFIFHIMKTTKVSTSVHHLLLNLDHQSHNLIPDKALYTCEYVNCMSKQNRWWTWSYSLQSSTPTWTQLEKEKQRYFGRRRRQTWFVWDRRQDCYDIHKNSTVAEKVLQVVNTIANTTLGDVYKVKFGMNIITIQHRQISTGLHDLVFVTDVAVQSEPDVGIRFFTQNFDTFVWFLLLVAIFLSGLIEFFQQRSTRVELLLGRWAQILEMHIDQYPSFNCLTDQLKCSISDVTVTVLRIIWMLAVVVLCNAYKGKVSSKMVVFFPYRSELQDWRQYKDFSLYSFLGKAGHCHTNSTAQVLRTKYRVLYINTTEVHNSFLQCEIYRMDRISAQFEQSEIEDCNLYRNSRFYPFYIKKIIRFDNQGNLEKTCFLRHPNVVVRSIFADFLLGYKCKAKVTNIDTEGSSKTFPQTGPQTGGAYHNSLCVESKWVLGNMIRYWDVICPQHLNYYIGKRYADNVDRYTELRFQRMEDWDSKWKKEEKFREVLYWLTRKPKAAFVMYKMDFPYYWNLFKRAMKQDKSLKFAHSGHVKLREIQHLQDPKQEIEVETFKNESPNSKRMNGNLKALISSGLIAFWEKWDRIRYSPTGERANQQIPEVLTGGTPLSLDTDYILVIFNGFLIGITLATVSFLLEKCISLIKARVRWIKLETRDGLVMQLKIIGTNDS